jgi:small-conductance mechanosensitive channel
MLLDIFARTAAGGEYVFMLLCMLAAWQIGKSVASDWKPLTTMVVYTLLLGCGARFLHFALYQAPFISLSRYLVDTLVLLTVAYIGYRFTRTNMMTRQYHWLYEKASPISWKDRA